MKRFGLGLGLGLGLGVTVARAEAIGVDIAGCGTIDKDEVERIVQLELSSVVSDPSVTFPRARVSCDGARMKIVIDDPVTNKHLARELPTPMGKGRERTFALAISQLYLTSWMELAMRPPPEPIGPPPNAPGAKAARTIASKKIEPEPTWSADALLGVALRSRGGNGANDLVGLLRAAAYLPNGFGAFILASTESMRVERTRGNVDVSLDSVGVGAAYRSPGKLAFDSRLGAALIFARLDGRPSSERTTAGGGSGTALDVALAGGPTLLAGPFRIGVEGQLGYLLPAITADVSGESSVHLHGFWYGLGVHVGMGFGAP
jgi:hypothetical protein